MIRPDLDKWGQSPDDLQRSILDAPHPRTRERFLALFMIATGRENASSWARSIGREDETVLRWVRAYNDCGPDALTYRRTGGPPPFCPPSRPKRSSPQSATPGPSTMASPATAGP